MRDNRRVTNDHAAVDMIVGERRRGRSKMLRATWLIGFLLVVALGWSTAVRGASITRHADELLPMVRKLLVESCGDAAIVSPGRAVLWEGDRLIELGTLGGPTSYAFAINDAGQVVGAAATAEDECHAFLWEAGQMTILDDLGGPESADTAINSTRQ